MMLGPKYIYRCPNCKNLIYNWSLLSGNTFDAKLYSDGKQVAPMMPSFPAITKCKKCDTIFWLNDEVFVGKEELGEKDEEKKYNAERADFLSVYDCASAIATDLCKSIEDEKYFRSEIVYGFNDRVRDGNPKFINEGDGLLWETNIYSLIDLLDINILIERVLSAGLYRYLGNFSKCMEILNAIGEPQLDLVKEKLMAECEKGNRELIVLFE